MKIMRRRLLQLIGIGVASVASPMMASAGGGFKIAMGETSAAQKPGGSGTAVTTCSPYAPCSKPRNRPKHPRARAMYCGPDGTG
jgi:hypothetical protein